MLLALALGPGSGAVMAQQAATGAKPPEANGRLEQVEKSLEKSRREGRALSDIASRLARQISDLRKERVKAARTAHDYERRVAALADTIAELDTERRTKTRDLQARRARLADILGALQRMARQPPEALIALPGKPQDTLRSAILMRTVLPEIEAEARTLKARLVSLATLKVRIKRKRRALANESQSLKRQRARLGKLLRRKTAFERTTRIERDRTTARAQSLATEAKDLRELLSRLDAERKARLAALRIAPPQLARPALSPPKARKKAAPIHRARGKFMLPAQGRVVQRFGKKVAYGSRAKGILIQTLGGAQVISPYEGVVVFSGKFRDYGQVLIIEHGGGYHSLLAGLKRIDSVVSQRLVAGEPVGVMGLPAKEKPRLYIELRRNGRPINPLPWLAAPTDKVSG
ncbi:MAG: peptidoglycan DD-metalloendopeptidase family protein [Alphaproteobacteria bacterium]